MDPLPIASLPLLSGSLVDLRSLIRSLPYSTFSARSSGAKSNTIHASRIQDPLDDKRARTQLSSHSDLFISAGHLHK
jgi:hypothetical protein